MSARVLTACEIRAALAALRELRAEAEAELFAILAGRQTAPTRDLEALFEELRTAEERVTLEALEAAELLGHPNRTAPKRSSEERRARAQRVVSERLAARGLSISSLG